MKARPLPAMYLSRGRNKGPHQADGVCTRCGQPLKECVPLEFDQRINEYHDFRIVPADKSQGWFVFDPDCAEWLRIRARMALHKDVGPFDSPTSCDSDSSS